jgi:hypothetical protein
MRPKKLYAIAAMILLNSMAYAKVGSRQKPMSIQNAIEKGIIKAEFKGKGGHSGDVIELRATNLIADSIYVKVEGGRRLDSKNNDEQDIMVMVPCMMALSKKQVKTFTLNGFCCEANKHSPQSKSLFSVGKMADSSFVRLSRLLGKKKYSNSDIQSAVWCLSDRQPVSNISKGLQELRSFVAKEQGVSDPWYQTEMVAPSEGRVSSNQVSKIFGNMTYTLRNDCALTIQLLDHNGHLVQTFSSNKLLQRGTYDYWFELTVTNFPKGKYYVKVMGDTQEILKKEFLI